MDAKPKGRSELRAVLELSLARFVEVMEASGFEHEVDFIDIWHNDDGSWTLSYCPSELHHNVKEPMPSNKRANAYDKG